MPEPTTPPATPATPATPAAAKIDPMVANLMKSFGKAIDPSEETPIEPVPEPAAAPVVDDMTRGSTLGETVELLARRAKEKAATAPKEDDAPASPEAPATATTAAAAAPAAKPSVVVKKKALPDPGLQAPSPAAPAPAPAPADASELSSDDQEYLKSAEPDTRFQIELAAYAEKNGHKGKLAQTLKYFRDIDKLVADNPDITPDDEIFKEFTEKNEPKWNKSVLHRLQLEMVADQKIAKERSQSQQELQETRRRLRELEVKPVVDKQVESLFDEVTSTDLAQGDNVAISPEIVDTIRNDGYEAAVAKYPVEAPILRDTDRALRTWTGLVTQSIPYNNKDPLHVWCLNFFRSEGDRMKQLPAEQTTKNGKKFLTLVEYSNECARDPNAQSKYYTFDAGNLDTVTELLAANAVLSVNNEVKRLEKGGFRYERRTPKTPKSTQAVPPPSTPSGSPGSGFRAMPGAAPFADAPRDARVDFFEKLIPGGAKMAGL